MSIELITKSLILYHIQVVRKTRLEKIEDDIRASVVSKIISGDLST